MRSALLTPFRITSRLLEAYCEIHFMVLLLQDMASNQLQCCPSFSRYLVLQGPYALQPAVCFTAVLDLSCTEARHT